MMPIKTLPAADAALHRKHSSSKRTKTPKASMLALLAHKWINVDREMRSNRERGGGEGERGREGEGKGGRQGGRNGENPACHSSIEGWMLHKRLHSGHPNHAGDRQNGKVWPEGREKNRRTRPKNSTSKPVREIWCSYHGEKGTTRGKSKNRIMDVSGNINTRTMPQMEESGVDSQYYIPVYDLCVFCFIQRKENIFVQSEYWILKWLLRCFHDSIILMIIYFNYLNKWVELKTLPILTLSCNL